MLRYAICCTGRSGSSLLCDWLRNNGIGKPDEWLRDVEPSQENFSRIVAEHTVCGIFGVKLGLWSYTLWRPEFDFHIYLHRRDTLAQAISYYRADATNVWATTNNDKLSQDVPFDPVRILEYQRDIEYQNRQWQEILTDRLEIAYEDMIAEPVRTLRQIADYLGVELHNINLDVARTISRDDLTKRWLLFL